MRSIAHIIVAILINALGLLAAAYFIFGVSLNGDIKTFIVMALVLTLLNAALKPILKLILAPIILITLGLGLILVNAIILNILDKIFINLTIASIPALLYASLVIGFVNFIFHLSTKDN